MFTIKKYVISELFFSLIFFFLQATDGDVGSFGIVRYYFSDEPDQ